MSCCRLDCDFFGLRPRYVSHFRGGQKPYTVPRPIPMDLGLSWGGEGVEEGLRTFKGRFKLMTSDLERRSSKLTYSAPFSRTGDKRVRL